MGDQHQGGAAFTVEFKQQVADALAGMAVEVAGGFIGEQHGRFGNKGTGNRHALLLATGQLARVVGQTMPQAHPLKQGACPLAGIGMAFQLQRQHDVFQSIEAVEQLERLEHETDLLGAQARTLVFIELAQILAGQVDAATAGQVEAGEQAQQGRLARAGAADNRQAVTAAQVQAQVVQDAQFAFRARDHFVKVPGSKNRCVHQSGVHALALRRIRCGRGE